jgi:hypothetical protein
MLEVQSRDRKEKHVIVEQLQIRLVKRRTAAADFGYGLFGLNFLPVMHENILRISK